MVLWKISSNDVYSDLLYIGAASCEALRGRCFRDIQECKVKKVGWHLASRHGVIVL